MTKLKRLICLLFVFLLTAGTIAGCALVERDVDYFNNMTVATIGAEVHVRKSQLVNAYNNYGHQYIQQGMTPREAVERTLDEVIDREIMVELSIQNFSHHIRRSQLAGLREKKGLESLYYTALYENEKAEVRRSTFQTLDGFYGQLQDRVRDERNLAFRERDGAFDPNNRPPAPAMQPFAPYQPFVTRNFASPGVPANTVFTLDISSHVNKELIDAPMQWSPDIDECGDNIVEIVKTEALVRLVRVLTNNERGMRRQSMAEASLVEDQKLRGESVLNEKERALIGRELARMIEEQSKSILAQRFQDIFELGISEPIDRSDFTRAEDYEAAILNAIRATGGHRPTCDSQFCNGCEDVRMIRANNLAMQAQNFYRSQILTQHNRFVRGFDTVDSLSNGVLDSVSDTFWLPTEVAQNHFTVSHILIQYNDAQEAEFARIKAEFGQGGTVSVENYNARMRALAGSLTTRARDEDGVEYGPEKTAFQIRDEIVNELGGRAVHIAQPTGNFEMRVPTVSTPAEEQRRINLFRDYIYKYNADPGMMNAEFEYVIGVENSRMVPAFTAASRELFGYKQVARKHGGQYLFDHDGALVIDWEKNPSFTPQRSGMTFDLVMTDFGAHIVMYTRTLSDFIYNTDMRNSRDVRLVDFNAFDMAVNAMLANLSGTNYLFAPITSYGDQFGQILFPDGKQPINAVAKTWFDIAVERMNQPVFDNMRKSLITNFKSEREGGEEDGRLINPIRLYRNNFKDLW